MVFTQQISSIQFRIRNWWCIIEANVNFKSLLSKCKVEIFDILKILNEPDTDSTNLCNDTKTPTQMLVRCTWAKCTEIPDAAAHNKWSVYLFIGKVDRTIYKYLFHITTLMLNWKVYRYAATHNRSVVHNYLSHNVVILV